jgi:uncharacterized protein (TIGR03083 family)
MPIPHDTIAKLEETFAALSSLGAGLDESQWKAPTELPGWTVQDNLAHVIGTERMLQGLPGAERVDALGEHVRNPIGQFNEFEVEARRSRSGAEVLAEWDELAALRLRTLRGGDEAYFDQPMQTPTGPGTMADFLHIRVLDCWSHLEDMRRAVGAPSDYGCGAATHTIDRLARTLPIVVGKRAGTPEGGAVAIELTGPVARRFVLEVRDGRAQQVEHATSAPLATVRLDCEAFTVLALGRRSASELRDRIVIEGDRDLGQRVVDQLGMMI